LRRRRQQVAAATLHGDTQLGQRRFDVVGDGALWRDLDLVPRHADGVGLVRQIRDDLCSVAAAQCQRGADLLQAGRERAQRLRQPPLRGGAR